MSRHPYVVLTLVTVGSVAAILAALATVAARHVVNPDLCRRDIDAYITGTLGDGT